MDWETLQSEQDSSVNFVADAGDGGKIEARYVQREADQFIIYLSSHSGCNKSCRFCHLTATRQVTFSPVRPEIYGEQAWVVYQHYDALRLPETPSRVNYNWMARGEPLANPYMLTEPYEIIDELAYMARERNLNPSFKVSTIMPLEIEDLILHDVFRRCPIDFYYSLYSMDEGFRKRWLPKAIPVPHALDKLYLWQQETGRKVWFHWAFIEGENDSLEDVNRIVDAVMERELDAKFNLVRYNPPNDKSREACAEVLERNFEVIRAALGDAQVVSRVGFDVKASCGMFV